MAYASKLSEEKFSVIYRELMRRSFQAAKAQYEKKVAEARTESQRRACAGYYPSEWSELLEDWCRDRATNLYVLECLKLGHVHPPELLHTA